VAISNITNKINEICSEYENPILLLSPVDSSAYVTVYRKAAIRIEDRFLQGVIGNNIARPFRIMRHSH